MPMEADLLSRDLSRDFPSSPKPEIANEGALAEIPLGAPISPLVDSARVERLLCRSIILWPTRSGMAEVTQIDRMHT